MTNWQIHQGNAWDVLKTMPDASVQCSITSPPYYGLRSYKTEPQIWDGDDLCDHEFGAEIANPKLDTRPTELKIAQGGSVGSNVQTEHWSQGTMGAFCRCGAWRGELGLEPTFQLYLSHLLQIFVEVKRVVKASGTIFVNLGDSYSGSGRGHNGIGNQTKRQGFSSAANVQRGVSYDTSDIKLEDSQDRDCFCRSLCGGCREAYRNDISRNDCLPVPTPILLLSAPNHEHTESQSDHLPTSGSFQRPSHIEDATLDSVHLQDHEAEQLPASLESTHGQSSERLLGAYLQKASISLCLSCGCLIADDVLLSECMTACRSFSQTNSPSTSDHYANTGGNEATDDSLVNHIQDTAYAPFPYLDYNITSRPVLPEKSLMNIPHRFFIKLTDELGLIQRNNINWWKRACMPSSAKNRFTVDFESIGFFTKSARYKFNQIFEPQVDWGPRDRTNGKYFAEGLHSERGLTGRLNPEGRNCRTTWDFAFEPSSHDHYAAYPSKMCDRMILAGSDEGDTVLDIFSGTASTGLSALRLKRNFVGIELNPDYIAISEKRLAEVQVKLF